MMKPTRTHPTTSQKAIRGVSQSVLEKILAGPPNQMVTEETNLPRKKKDRVKGRKPKPKSKA